MLYGSIVGKSVFIIVHNRWSNVSKYCRLGGKPFVFRMEVKKVCEQGLGGQIYQLEGEWKKHSHDTGFIYWQDILKIKVSV